MNELELINGVLVVALCGLWWWLHDVLHPPPVADANRPQPLAMTDVQGALPTTLDAPEAGPPAIGEVLARIGRAGGYRDAASFLEEAKQSYERIVGTFARGDIAGIAHLLSAEVKRDFERFIDARLLRGEIESLTFIGLRGADIVDAAIDGDLASIEVRFLADLVTVTRSAGGKVIAGNPERVVGCSELWIFQRQLRHKHSTWLLSATDADE
jgi:predicted lipid-binding transport protein (Tim44 family)